MIEIFRTYFKSKAKIEILILNGKIFDDVSISVNPVTKKEAYPITSQKNGVFFEIDEYRGFVTGISKMICNEVYQYKISKDQNIKFSDLQSSLRYVHGLDRDFATNTISQITLCLNIPTSDRGQDIIRNNIIIHKNKTYNHNHDKKKKKVELKKFVYGEYTLTISAEKSNNQAYNLKFKLLLHKSQYKKHITQPHHLLDKKNHELLFQIFLKKFQELIIIDDYQNIYEPDKKTLTEYLSHNYWENLLKNKGKHVKHRQWVKFKKLIAKYKLDSLKQQLNNDLTNAFHNTLK